MHYLQRLWRHIGKLSGNFRNRIACGICRGAGMEGYLERHPTDGLVEVKAPESKEWLLEWDKKPHEEMWAQFWQRQPGATQGFITGI